MHYFQRPRPNRVAGKIALRFRNHRTCGPASGDSGCINEAIPQLLLASAWAILPLVMKGRTAVFPHRGLSPHQFTPMSGAHHRPGVDAEWRVLFAFLRTRPRATQAVR